MLESIITIDVGGKHEDIRALLVSSLQRCRPHEGGSCLAKPWAIVTYDFESLLPEDVGSDSV